LRPLTPDRSPRAGHADGKGPHRARQLPAVLNTLLLGCNQKSSRDPVMELTEAEMATALDTLMP
jgi:uncharacterized protein YceH (UPF0502 family)